MQEKFKSSASRGELNRNHFARTFQKKGSKIKHSDLFALHARTICVDEENYLGLLGLDIVMNNRQGRVRKKDQITPDINHQLDIFFQLQNFQVNDEKNINRAWKYLPVRPDLVKVLAFLHDEGEDELGFKKADLKMKLYQFINQVDEYVDLHNQHYPYFRLPYPTPDQREQMFNDAPIIIEAFDILTKSYKGEPSRKTYFEYGRDIIGLDSNGQLKEMSEIQRIAHLIACEVKPADKAVNMATISVRNKATIEAMVTEDINAYEKEISIFKTWAHKQIANTRYVFLDCLFGNEHVIRPTSEDNQTRGFMDAMAKHYPELKHYANLLKNVLDIELQIYTHDLVHNGEGLENVKIEYPEYTEMALSPRLDLLEITRNRLQETHRIDMAGKNHLNDEGMFGLKFPDPDKREPSQPIPLNNLPIKPRFTDQNFDALRQG